MIRALEGSAEMSLSSIGSTHITFRENYAKYLRAKSMMADQLTLNEHLVEMQAFVLERAETAGIDLEEIKRLLQRWESDVKKYFLMQNRLSQQRSNSTVGTNAHSGPTKKQMMRSRGLDLSRRRRPNVTPSPVREEE